jgi:hypothetical protein
LSRKKTWVFSTESRIGENSYVIILLAVMLMIIVYATYIIAWIKCCLLRKVFVVLTDQHMKMSFIVKIQPIISDPLELDAYG